MRVISLSPLDTKPIEEKVRLVTEGILEALGEIDSKTMRTLLTDQLKSYWDDDIEDMYTKVVVKKEKVKTRPGCFRIIIGDGRKKGHGEIQLTD